MHPIILDGKKYYYHFQKLSRNSTDPIFGEFRINFYRKVIVPKWKFWFIKSSTKIENTIDMGYVDGTFEIVGDFDSMSEMKKQREIVRPSLIGFITEHNKRTNSLTK